MLVYSAEVARARKNGEPVVALESTIIAHGMPHPINLDVAHRLEAAIRAEGAVPATIAVIDGAIHIGLEEAQLARMAQDPSFIKLSRRDLPIILAQGGNGATTVAATMICAARAGIKVFATGGIGGVHRDGQVSMDVSADLEELARTNVAVVCAGAKSILDLGRTLEVLETKGVPVIGYGTDRFPAFYVRDSGHNVPARLDSPDTIAAMLRVKWALDLAGGAIIANPVPEEHELDPALMHKAVAAAEAAAETAGITGKDLTPFLLAQIKEQTAGASLKTNIALALNNATLAAQVAVALNAAS